MKVHDRECNIANRLYSSAFPRVCWRISKSCLIRAMRIGSALFPNIPERFKSVAVLLSFQFGCVLTHAKIAAPIRAATNKTIVQIDFQSRGSFAIGSFQPGEGGYCRNYIQMGDFHYWNFVDIFFKESHSSGGLNGYRIAIRLFSPTFPPKVFPSSKQPVDYYETHFIPKVTFSFCRPSRR